MICLGIESTAHTFGASVSELRSGSFQVRSDSKDVYKAPPGSGIHPREASRHHEETCSDVVEKALAESRCGMKEIDFVAYSAGPGLGPCLRVGAVVARSLASYFGKEIVPVNHAIGHIELGKLLLGLQEPLVLLISGGHTVIAAESSEGWKIFGETMDLTVGQLLDQLGRFFGMNSPAGPKIEAIAAELGSAPNIVQMLPYAIKGNDVSYSGLLSSAKEAFLDGSSQQVVCFSVQEIAFALLAEATERALAFTDKKELLVTGGVAANQRLSAMLRDMCDARGVRLGVIPKQFAGDCGSQIAAAGFLFHEKGRSIRLRDAFVRQSWRIDQVNFSSVR
ncbi:MAG: KEOPS complex N(6)-L-threonylcarbamoyladenine synthase Kae1 [Thaumarchaeota archaeon]|nr:KEOPS complex N(6)-L-threonylcarbamoyladenine synthase Kae1 [Nitrososphaerota archaeon]